MGTEFRAASADAFEALAREALPSAGFETHFGTRGAPSWETNTNNLLAFERWRIRPRILSGVTKPSLKTVVLGKTSDPFMIGPVGGQQRFHAAGEIATFKAAQEAGITAVLSTMATFSIEDVAAAAPGGRRWFQAYIMRDRELSRDLIARAEAAGYEAIVLTVDNISGHLARPRRYKINGLSGPSDVVWPTQEEHRVLANFHHLRGTPAMPSASLSDCFDGTFAWKDIDWLRSITRLPIILKGVQVPEDALLALDHGLEGIIISNHGGVPAAMDNLGPTLAQLPAIAAAVGNRMEVYLDGGIRRGSDILTALALGAKAVLIGRAAQWALAAGGRDGVLDLIDLLRDELRSAMTIAGHQDISAIGSTTVEPA